MAGSDVANIHCLDAWICMGTALKFFPRLDGLPLDHPQHWRVPGTKTIHSRVPGARQPLE